MTFSPLTWLRSRWIAPEEIRAETWALGCRHRGEILAGARIEAAIPGVSARRAVLLKAIIRRHAGGASAAPAVSAPRSGFGRAGGRP